MGVSCMNTSPVEQRLRTFLLVTSGFLCVGTIIELLLAKHYEDVVQLLPFVLCGVGFIAVGAALLRPRPMTLWLMRGVMVISALGSLFGIWEHLESNAGFVSEIQPNATGIGVWLQALGGAAPLLAPGILALAAVLALAGTYAHPALQRNRATASNLAPSEPAAVPRPSPLE